MSTKRRSPVTISTGDIKKPMSHRDGETGCWPSPTSWTVHRIWPTARHAAPPPISIHETRSRPPARRAVSQHAAAAMNGVMHCPKSSKAVQNAIHLCVEPGCAETAARYTSDTETAAMTARRWCFDLLLVAVSATTLRPR